jgi:succinate-semialdehyde dehydrogenase/glutarate-semialdehyde dehydrogenase
MGETLMSLIAGNAVVLKPSEITPLIALKAKELWDRTGLPRDLFQVVTGRGETGAALIESGVNQVVFTGSVATGKRVAAACGARLIPCTMELGGKAPAVVCEDAPLERTARALVWGAFANSGQVCVSVERVYIPASIHDALVERVVALTRELRQGDGHDEVDVGAMTWDRQIDTVERQVDEAVRAGARALTGGKRREGRGRFFPPTVLVDCTPDMPILRAETFGPVLPICKVATVEEAMRLANDSHLGLNAYVFTADRRRGEELAVRIEAGTVMVNDVLSAYGMPETPFGGVKESGLGRVHSDDGLRDLCEKRHVNIDRLGPPKKELWWYPYSQKTIDLTKRAMRFLYRG